MHLVIAKVDEVYFDGEAESVTLPGAEGEMTVLPEHEPFITTLKAGSIKVRSQAGEQIFAVGGGILEINREGATVIL